MLVLIMGLPGSGKTSLARAYANKYHAMHLNSDQLRKELSLMGQYTDADKATVYQALLQRARQILALGHTLVIDSTFYLEAIRAPFRDLAQGMGVPLFWVEVQADEAHTRSRIQLTRPDSEADFEVYLNIKAQFEPLQEPHLYLRTDEGASLDELAEKMHLYLNGHPL